MRVYGYNEFNWEDNKLYRGKEETGLLIEKDLEYPPMWRFKYKDYTSDIFNKTRVKDNAIRYMMEELNKTGQEKPLEAHWCV